MSTTDYNNHLVSVCLASVVTCRVKGPAKDTQLAKENDGRPRRTEGRSSKAAQEHGDERGNPRDTVLEHPYRLIDGAN